MKQILGKTWDHCRNKSGSIVENKSSYQDPIVHCWKKKKKKKNFCTGIKEPLNETGEFRK